MKWRLLFLFGIIFFKITAQGIEKNKKVWMLGLNYGQSTQEVFLLNNADYSYDNQFLKAQINYLLLKKRKFSYELHLEPGLFFSEHQLLNKFFVQPRHGMDYLEQRERFTQLKSFKEYVINVGFIIRYHITQEFSTYFLGSLGPMYSEEGTERLKKGLAFSDVLGLGLSYKLNKMVLLDIRTSFRHNSNANLAKPNSGHDSFSIESGIWFRLN